MILFDAMQEETEDLLNENIRLIKLDKCNGWCELVNQMVKYENIFV
jgi:hypothetical protein